MTRDGARDGIGAGLKSPNFIPKTLVFSCQMLNLHTLSAHVLGQLGNSTLGLLTSLNTITDGITNPINRGRIQTYLWHHLPLPRRRALIPKNPPHPPDQPGAHSWPKGREKCGNDAPCWPQVSGSHCCEPRTQSWRRGKDEVRRCE
ncbi:hypothetical protein ABEF92_003121 [Exophiala dermatitidis]|uniref:Uncharacterized protein n=1 Tax=Exophiala dermatitidis (strain ATCC 34100 / CBS 525.76 / NIH/UT8656) TaxID=858893 RepID=H6C8X4_EXODN|nr:uncharacterized protein HMPREF1120_08506 [Exophiala dermatitidis NIH/UT8656]EHY60551.1 hypothetical protein HMPREF1120_08506 [Exophiala dermatitidis NIH/UT8656]